MWKNFRRKMEADSDYFVQLLGIGLFTIISGWATFKGLLSFQKNDPIFAAMITLGVQALIVFTARRLAQVKGLAGILLLLPVLGIFWLFSSGLATAYWWGVFDADRHARASFSQQAETLMRPLTDFKLAYSDLSGELSTLAAYSRQRAEEELKRGGTCGDGARRGPGPRQRLRLEDARLFSAHARRFDERASTFGKLVATLEQQVKSFDTAKHADITRQVARVQRTALALSRGAELQALRADLQAQLDKHVNGLKDRRGQLVRCPDARLESGIRSVLQRIDNLPRLPEQLITVHETTRERNTVFLYQQLMAILTGEPTELNMQDVAMPLLFGFLPDLAILLLSLFLGRAERHGGGGMPPRGWGLRLPEVSQDTRKAAPVIEGEMQQADSHAARALRVCTWRTSRKRSMMVVPENPPHDNEEAQQVLRMAETLEAGDVIQLRSSGFPVHHLRRDVREQMQHVLRGVQRVMIYDAPVLLAHLFNAARMRLDETAWPPEPPGDTPRPPADAANDDASMPAGTMPAAAQAKVHRVVITADDDGHFRPMATFNDRFSTPALIDTGATGIALPHGMAWMMGINPATLDFRHTSQTANGEMQVAPVVLKKLCIGGLCVRDVKAHVAPPGALDEPLIGMRFLRALRGFRVENGELLILEGEMEEERPAA